MEERLNKIEERLSRLEDNKEHINTVIAVFSSKLDSIISSLDKLALQQDKNMNIMTDRYDKLNEKYAGLRDELNEKTIEKDADKWNKIIIAVATGIVGVIIGLIFKK